MHTAPEGQHAGELSASSAQVWPVAQQTPLKAEPSLAQLKVPDIQPLVWRAKSAWTGVAARRRPRVGVAVSAGRNSCCFASTEGRYVMRRARFRVRVRRSIGQRYLRLMVAALIVGKKPRFRLWRSTGAGWPNQWWFRTPSRSRGRWMNAKMIDGHRITWEDDHGRSARSRS